MDKKPTGYNRWTNAVAQAIGTLFPKTAMSFVRSRNALATYAAASKSGPNKAWLPSNKSADEIIKTDQPLLRARARSLVRDSSQVSGALRKITNNVVFKGINPQARLKSGDDLDKEKNDITEAAWKAWALAVGWHEKENLIIRHWWQDGEMFAHYYFDQELADAGLIPLGVELLECDHLDTAKSGIESGMPGKKGTWKQGILYSDYKRALGYQLFIDHPGASTWWSSNFGRNVDVYTNPPNATPIASWYGSKFYDAYMTDHLFIKDRISQNRGLPWLTAIIMEMRDFNEYQAAERIAARLAAAFGIFVTTQYPEQWADGAPSPVGGDGQTMTADDIPDYLEPGRIQPLPPGMDVTAPAFNRPGQSYEPFTKTSLRGASTGLNMSYEAYSNDYSEATYSSARSATLEERRGYQVQQLILLRQFHAQAWQRLWTMNQLTRTVQGMPDAIPVNWQVPGWPWVDPDKDSKAAERDLKNRLTSRHKILDGRGEDYNEINDDLWAESDNPPPTGVEEKQNATEIEVEVDEGQGRK